MRSNTECIVDDNGIEITVEYQYEVSESQIEEGHGLHDVGGLAETIINTVEIVIAGTGIDITSSLNEKQKSVIISKLTYL